MPFNRRLTELQAALAASGRAGALLTFSRDVYYYTGLGSPAVLAVFPDEFRLYLRAGDERVNQAAAWFPGPVRSVRRLGDIAADALADRPAGPIGLTPDSMSAVRFLEITDRLNGRTWFDAAPLMWRQRMIKDDTELEWLKRAAAAVHQGHLAAMEAIRPGRTELEVAAEVERAQRLAGNEGHNFSRDVDLFMSRGPVASGDNTLVNPGVVFTIGGVGLSPASPIGPSRRRLAEGDLVVIDIPSNVGGYHADQSRTYSVGRPPDRARAMAEGLIHVVDRLADGFRPGSTTGGVYDLAWAAAREAGLADSFLTFPEGKRAHYVGHGVGLEINEPPLVARGGEVELVRGMVLAIEVHARDDRAAVKIEDTVVITDQGAEFLTFSPRGLNVVQFVR